MTLKPGEKLTAAHLTSGLAGGKPDYAALWVGPEDMPAVAGLAEDPNRPDKVFLSAVYLGEALWGLDEKARGFAYFTYPYRLPNEADEGSVEGGGEAPREFNYLTYPYGVSYDEMKYRKAVALLVAKTADKDVGGVLSERYRVLGSTYSIIQVLTQILMDMRGSYYRDYFLDVIGMAKDRALPLYERLSFGPGQRYASKGCYIVQLKAGDKPELANRTGWMVH